jgi:hypothetical protein
MSAKLHVVVYAYVFSKKGGNRDCVLENGCILILRVS